MGDASCESGSSLDLGRELAPVERGIGPLRPEEAINLEYKCRQDYKLGERAATTAQLIQARALWFLRETLGVHPQTGEVVPIWALGPDGCEAWSQYCWDVLGLDKSRASRLCSVWEVYHVRLGIPEERLQETAFTKLREPLRELKDSLGREEDPDPELMEAVFDPEVSTRELAETIREKRGVERYRVWWGRWDGEGRDLLLSGPNGDVLCGRLTLNRLAGATSEEWERVERWAQNI